MCDFLSMLPLTEKSDWFSTHVTPFTCNNHPPPIALLTLPIASNKPRLWLPKTHASNIQLQKKVAIKT